MIIVFSRSRLRKVMEENRKKREKREKEKRKQGDAFVANQSLKKNPPCIEDLYPDATIIDVTSKSEDKFIKMSPFYPHKGIPIPYSPNWISACVEAIWQGLKVFEKADIDTDLFTNTSMKNLKRLSNKRNGYKYGKILGHRIGVNGRKDHLLNAVEARRYIYVPAYRWVLENKVPDLVEEIRDLSNHGTVILLDYETNCDITIDKPISHAGLIKMYIEGNYPEVDLLAVDYISEERLARYPIGGRVRHIQFGVGCITGIQKSKATVLFRSGERVIDLRSDTLEPFDGLESFEVESNGEKATLLQNEHWLFGVQANPAKKVETIPCEYEQIVFYAGKRDKKQINRLYYFLVKKNGRWGLLNKLGRQQAPCIYDDLKPIETAGLMQGFAYKREGIIDGNGNEITIENDGQ